MHHCHSLHPLILSCSEALDASKCSRMCAFSALFGSFWTNIANVAGQRGICSNTFWSCYLVLFVPVVSTVQKIWRTNRQQFHWVRQWRIRSMHQKHCRIQLGAGGMDRDGYVRIVWRCLKVSDLTRFFPVGTSRSKHVACGDLNWGSACWPFSSVVIVSPSELVMITDILSYEGHLLEHWF